MKNNIYFKFTTQQKKRIKKNFISLLSNLSSKLLLQIIYPPLMLLFWGVDNFGIWVFVTAIPSTLTMFNLNFSLAAKTEMSINDAKNKKKLVNEIFQNGFGLIIMNMIIFTTIWFSAFLLTDLEFAIFESINPSDLRHILLLIVLSFYFTIFNGILVTGITYWGKLNIATNVITFFDFLSKLSIIICGIFTDSLTYAAIIFFIVSIIQTIILWYYYSLYKKYLFLSIKLVSIKNSLKLFWLSLSYYAEAITSITKHNGLIILLGIFFTGEIVGLVSTAKTLFYFLPLKFINLLVHTSIYEYSVSHSIKKMQLLKHNFKSHMFYTIIILTLFVLGSLIIGPKVYNFWTNYKYELNYFLLLFIVFESFFYCLRDSICAIIKSVNRFLKPASIEALLSILSLLISYYYLTLSNNLIIIFLISLIATFVSLIVFTYFSLQFYYKLR